MKNIYLSIEKSIKELQSIFKNADDKDEKLKRFNQEALDVSKIRAWKFKRAWKLEK